jgi:hypothetical protein
LNKLIQLKVFNNGSTIGNTLSLSNFMIYVCIELETADITTTGIDGKLKNAELLFIYNN